jgi:hypothetical protein
MRGRYFTKTETMKRRNKDPLVESGNPRDLSPQDGTSEKKVFGVSRER